MPDSCCLSAVLCLTSIAIIKCYDIIYLLISQYAMNKWYLVVAIAKAVIVIFIIVIIVFLLLPKFYSAQQKARDTTRQWAIRQIAIALDQYYGQEGTYPKGECVSHSEAINLSWLLAPYINEIPHDPQKSALTYGTKDWGCSNGSFAYAPMIKNGISDAGFVLVTNTEIPQKNANWVLENSPSIDFGPLVFNPSDPVKSAHKTFTEVYKTIPYVCQQGVETGKESSLFDCISSKESSSVYVLLR